MFSHRIWAWLVTALAAYLLGSVSGAITASKLFHKTDIRKYGSGNAGMTNALRTFGKKTAVWVTLIDVLKTLAALGLGQWLMGDMAVVVAGAGVVLGHAFPIYHRFKGGKCVMSSAVILLWLDWRVFAVAAGVFLLLALVTKIVAVGSMGAAVSAPFSTWLFLGREGSFSLTVFVACLAIFIVVLHHSNIRRIIEKRELPVTSEKKEK